MSRLALVPLALVAMAIFACGPTVPERPAGTVARTVAVREFAVSGGAAPKLGRVLALNLAEELQARGILAPIISANATAPRDIRVVVSGRIVRSGSGTLIAEPELVDSEHPGAPLERRFREHTFPIFGEADALHRDAVRLGTRIADWMTESNAWSRLWTIPGNS